jgi:hypothetical protein
MRYRTVVRFLLLTAIVIPCVQLSAQDVILGILEENHGHYVGEPNYRTVRVVFEKKAYEWRAFPSDCIDQACLKSVTATYPHQVKWTIAFDGKNVGRVESRAPDDFHHYGDVGQEVIIGTNPVPTIGAPSPDFGGYSEARVHRPLVANSAGYFADSEDWKPVESSPEYTDPLRQAFRKRFPKLCRPSAADESKLEEFPYRNYEVRVAKAYASAEGLLVARLHLEAVDCEDTEAGFDIDDPWFFVDTNKAAMYLNSGMWLVDAGDYDKDGRSELIFSINRENEGGYEIWYDHFRKHATFKFNYHSASFVPCSSRPHEIIPELNPISLVWRLCVSKV